jgi:hypothetical protein
MKSVDVNYIQLYGMKIVAGKNIGDSDTVQGFVINEKLANMFGYANPTDAIGQRMRRGNRKVYYPIVGVVQNFHTMSLHEPIEPTVLLSNARNFSTLSMKVDVRNFKESVKEIQQK